VILPLLVFPGFGQVLGFFLKKAMTPHTPLGTIGHLARLGLTNALAYFSSAFIDEDTKYYSFDTRLMLQQTLRMFGLK